MGTLFLPAESSSELPRPTLDAPRRRQPPPPPPTGRDRSGPPSIGLDDAGRHNELDLGGAAGGDLELDFGGAPGAPPVASPPPAIEMPSESGLDFPMLDEPSLFDPDEDLPGPVASPRRDPAADLPMPVVEARDPTADLPTPVAAPGLGPGMGGSGLDDLTGDLAGGFDFDLPAPVDQARAASMGPSFDADLPTPVELDLPLAGGASPDIGLDLPMPADQLGGAGQQLQPAYGNQGLRPAAGGQQLQPAYGDQDLRPAAGTQQLQPAYGDQDMRPAEIGVAPATLDMAPANLDMAPANLEMQPKLEGTELAPGDLPGPVPAGGPSARAAGGYPNAAPATSMGQTAPMPASSDGAAGSIAARTSQAGKPPAVSRGVLIAAGGLLLLGLAGAAVLYSGILDPDDPETTATRGAKKKTAAAKNDDDGGQTQGDDGGTQTPATVIAERSPAVLAILAKHTPQAYLEARAKATEAGDVIGAAEAALLLHFYYGPNPAMLAEAGKDLQPHVGNEAPFVQRVVGLASLAADNLDGADKALTGDDERTRLYRGWVHLQRGELDEAMAEAKAVITASPDEVAARHLELATRAKREPVAAIPAIQAALESNPSHAGLQALVATTGIATGRLAAARRAVDAIDPAGTDDPGVQAWSHVQRARVRLAQGDREGALADYDAAIERVPEVVPVQMERVRALVLAGLLNDASSSVSSLVREHPQDAQLQLLQAQVATRSGDVDIALGVLETLAVSLPEDPRVMITKGDAHTMRLEIDEGQTAYAAARALDPTAIEAAMGEAVLLSDAKQLPKALTVLEEARALAGAGGGPGGEAELLVAKARLHEQAGERNAALAALDRALAVAPEHNDAQMRRGAMRVQDGQLAEGRADLVAVFERTGGYPGLAAPLGRLYVAEGDYDALERLLGDRLRGDQTADDLLTLGARLRLFQGRTADARELVELALARRPADWEAHMLMAEVLIGEGKPLDALTQIERSTPPQPEPELMLQRGKILEYNGKYDDAVPEYRKALALQPELHEARFLFGRKLVYDGANGRGITELRKVADAPEAKRAPWYPEVFINIGRAEHDLGKYTEAIESLQQATKLDPDNGFAYAEQGRFHEFRNKHGEAIAALTKAVELGTPEDHWYADALMNLGRAQSKSGKAGAASKTLKRYLEVAPPEHASRAEAERLVRGG